MNFYTYLFKDPVSNIPRYAGKGQGERYRAHLKGRSKNKQLLGWIRNLREKGLEPIVEIVPANDEDLAFSLEIWFIYKFGRLDLKTGTLFNHTNGGEGTSGPVSEEKKAKHRVPRGPYSEERCAHLRGPRTPEQMAKRKPHPKLGPMSEEHKAKLRGPRGPRKPNPGPWSEESRAKKYKPCTVDGITIYPSVKAMVADLGGGRKGRAHPNFRFVKEAL